MAAAAPGETLTSRTVQDLVVGSDIVLEDRGTHRVKGVAAVHGRAAMTVTPPPLLSLKAEYLTRTPPGVAGSIRNLQPAV